jgi:hypothetical protein
MFIGLFTGAFFSMVLLVFTIPEKTERPSKFIFFTFILDFNLGRLFRNKKTQILSAASTQTLKIYGKNCAYIPEDILLYSLFSEKFKYTKILFYNKRQSTNHTFVTKTK